MGLAQKLRKLKKSHRENFAIPSKRSGTMWGSVSGVRLVSASGRSSAIKTPFWSFFKCSQLRIYFLSSQVIRTVNICLIMSFNALPSETLTQVYASISTVSTALNLSLVNRHLHNLWKIMASRLVEPILLREMSYSKQALRLVTIQEIVRQPGTVYDVDCSEQTSTKPQAYKKLRQLSVNAKDSERAHQPFRRRKNSPRRFKHPASYGDGLSSTDFYTLQSFIIAQSEPDILSQLEPEVITPNPALFKRVFRIMIFFLDPQFDLDRVFTPSAQGMPPPETRFTPFVTVRKEDWVSAYIAISNSRIGQLEALP